MHEVFAQTDLACQRYCFRSAHEQLLGTFVDSEPRNVGGSELAPDLRRAVDDGDSVVTQIPGRRCACDAAAYDDDACHQPVSVNAARPAPPTRSSLTRRR